jgi:hypothetical protein
MSVTLTEWVRLLRSEYLAEFIPHGGAAVKLAVAPADQLAAVLDAVATAAEAERCLVARVDASQTRVQQIDRLFYAVARQVEWEAVTDRYMRALLHEEGIQVDPALPLHEMDAIADANGRLKPDLYSEINRLIANRVLENYTLSREFRTAVALLCWGAVNPRNVSPSDAEIVKQWLIGEKWSLAVLKKLQLYQRISRHNARLHLSSLARWLHDAGFAGLALLLDLDAVVSDDRPLDSGLRYTRNAVLDTYEVLRQFIDETDESAHFLLVGVAGPALLDDPRRSVDNYTALKLRTTDEVRDRSRSNPLNAMVRLERA